MASDDPTGLQFSRWLAGKRLPQMWRDLVVSLRTSPPSRYLAARLTSKTRRKELIQWQMTISTPPQDCFEKSFLDSHEALPESR
jgi:hypothetical protein